MNSRKMLSELGLLVDPAARGPAVTRLSEQLGVETFIVFVPDPETGVLLAAPGFPQTLPEGRRWREFVTACAAGAQTQSPMPWPTAERLVPACAVAAPDGSVIAFIGGSPNEAAGQELLLLLPLLTAALKSERVNAMHAAQASFASELARQSETLARRLDDARRATQKELQERQRADAELGRAREQLQRHAEELEKRVADRTARLSETVGELEAFSYSVAHDMRAPLRAMQGYSEYLIEECGDKLEGRAGDLLRRISAAAVRLDRLIQDVLNYSKIVRGEFQLEHINVDHLVRSLIDMYRDWHPPRAEVVVEGILPAVCGNEAFLTQCVTNLIGNGIKFVPPHRTPRVTICGENGRGQVRLYFKDNGIGIEKKDQHRIFKIFERLHGPKEYAGTGIGLAIVRKAVERMGGKVGVEAGPGEGSIFWLELKGVPNATNDSAR